MESYIVRVYRRSSDNNEGIAGIIEKVGMHHKHSFSNLSGLQESLESPIGDP